MEGRNLPARFDDDDDDPSAAVAVDPSSKADEEDVAFANGGITFVVDVELAEDTADWGGLEALVGCGNRR